MKLPHAQFLVVIALLTSFDTFAAHAPVDELQVKTEQQAQPVVNQQQAEMFYKMQELQEEVRQLRGLIEEISYQLDRLKQRQQDDYLDLDRRISSAPAGTAGGTNAASTVAVDSTTHGSAGLPVGDAEKQAYNNAQALLKRKQFEPAQAAFNDYIQAYPNGKYVANSYYWLGQIYMLNNQLDKAQQAFANVVNNHPGSNRALDSALKLGKVYHRQGNTARARELLQKLAAGNTNISRQAQQYIDDNL